MASGWVEDNDGDYEVPGKIITATISSDSTVGTIIMTNKNIKFKTFVCQIWYTDRPNKLNSNITLSQGRYDLGATTLGDYALFAGGRNSSSYTSTVDAFDSNLIRTIPTKLINISTHLAAAVTGNYALFGGGSSALTYDDRINVYDTSLIRTNQPLLSIGRNNAAATSVGNYALFGGGYGFNTTTQENILHTTVDAYNQSLSRFNVSGLGVGRGNMAATSVGNYALFAGGSSYSISDKRYTHYNTVDSYSSTLVRNNPTALSIARMSIAATSIGNYALFAGGHYEVIGNNNIASEQYSNNIDVYTSILTKTNPIILDADKTNLAATTIGNYAIFAGGRANGNNFSSIDAYSASLVKTIITPLDIARYFLAAASIGNYAIFAGGYGSAVYDTIDVYTV